jgi:hypothetical protein
MARPTNTNAFSDSAVVPGNGNNCGQSACHAPEVQKKGAAAGTALGRILRDKKKAILGKWLDATMVSFPSGNSTHFRIKGDQFTNPTGSTISSGLEEIFDGLISVTNRDNNEELLDGIVRIMAVQDLAPSQSLSFFFSLKRIIREEFCAEQAESQLSQELVVLESPIYVHTLSAFDFFMKCRERIYEINDNEARRANFRLLQMAERIESVNGRKRAPKGDNLTMKEER